MHISLGDKRPVIKNGSLGADCMLADAKERPFPAALLHGCCTEHLPRDNVLPSFLVFAGVLEVGDAGFEPATSAV